MAEVGLEEGADAGTEETATWLASGAAAFAGVASLTVAVAFATGESWPARAGLLLAALVAAGRPRVFAFLLVAALPLFGAGPGGPRLPWLDATILAGLGGWLLWRGIRRTRLSGGGRLAAPVALFLTFSMVSLVPLRYHPPAGDLFEFGLVTRFLLLANEYVPAYTWTAALHLLSAVGVFLLALEVFRGERGGRTFARACAVAITLAAGAGLLEELGLISLAVFRPVFHLYTERMHSFFDHPGWLSQLLVLALPWPLLLLSSKRRSDRILATVAMVLGVVAIILTLQRAAWITALAAALALALFEGRRRPRRVVVAALAVLATIALVLVASPPARDRAKVLVSDLSNRTHYWPAGAQMVRERPLQGQGMGTFGWLYPSYIPNEDPRYMSMHGSAHNTYLMLAAERGGLGLAGYLLLLGTTGLLALRRPRVGVPFWTALVVIGLAQHVFYVRVVELFIWAALGALAAGSSLAAGSDRRRRGLWAAGLTLAALALLLRFIGPPFPATPGDREFGLHQTERRAGVESRWCYDACGFMLRGTGDILKIDLADAPPALGLERPLHVDLRVDGESQIRIAVPPSGTTAIWPLRPAPPGTPRRIVLIPERSFRPFLQHSEGRDPRLLGVRVARARLEPIGRRRFYGFHRRETDGTTAFRWSRGARSAISLRPGRKPVSLRLRTFAPDVATRPIVVRIEAPGFVDELSLAGNDWHIIEIPRPEEAPAIVRFLASRTWVPSAEGVGDDSRELSFSLAEWW